MESDICIIGGGINGTGIAADASGRGLSVILCEKQDLASGTSSCSTKLIHGGLRYLENFEFKLVRQALQEREILIKKAPHLISPLKFILPYEKQVRPAWMIRLGLFLYDYLAKRTTIPNSSVISLNHLNVLQDQFHKGCYYYDCFTDDARLVIENALAAKENGAHIWTHTEMTHACREKNMWKITLQNNITQEKKICYAKALINAGGPWVNFINQKIQDNQCDFSIELVKGSHIVIPKLYSENNAYILQNADQRIVFTIPFHEHYSLIGTTDVLVDHVEHCSINPAEVAYLCETVNHYFKKKIFPTDIVWSFSGVRCLQQQHTNKPSKTTRDYKLLVTTENNSLPLLTVIGGKITTFRHLAEEALEKIKSFFPTMGPSWTAKKPLPGGDIRTPFHDFFLQTKNNYSWLGDELIYRYVKNYGARVHLLLKNMSAVEEMGENFGGGLYQKEVDFLVNQEWARSTDDILWRRTKLGLFLTEENKNRLDKYVASIFF